jgi:hypothetical protein
MVLAGEVLRDPSFAQDDNRNRQRQQQIPDGMTNKETDNRKTGNNIEAFLSQFGDEHV